MRLRVLFGGVAAITSCLACSDSGDTDTDSAGETNDAGDASVDSIDAGMDAAAPTSTFTSGSTTVHSLGDAEVTDWGRDASSPVLTDASSHQADDDASTTETLSSPDAAQTSSSETHDTETSTEPTETHGSGVSSDSTAHEHELGDAGLPDSSTLSEDTSSELGSDTPSGIEGSSTGDGADDSGTADTTDFVSSFGDAGEDAAPDGGNAASSDSGSGDGSSDNDGSLAPEGGLTDGASPDASAESGWLSALQVVGGRYPLKPAFDPEIKRYSIVASSDNEVLELSATGSTSAPMMLNGQPLPAGETVALDDVDPGSDITITLADDPSGTEYVIKYLQPSFPDLVVTQSLPGASTDPLYTTLALSNAYFAVKFDNNGVPFYVKQEPNRVFDFKKHPNGIMSYASWIDPNNTGVDQVLLDVNFQEVDRLKSVGLVNTDFHEFLILPNGNFVFLAYEPVTRNLQPFGGGASVVVKDSIFQEVSPDSQVLFQWNNWQYFQYDDSVYAFTPTDYAHANTVFVDDDDNWLVSFRGFSQVTKIHRTTGDIIWRLGGLDSDFTFINDPFDGPCGQHTPSRLSNGHILIFDNGRDCLPEISNGRGDNTRVVEYALDEDAMTAELVWSYDRPGATSRSQGSAQRLDNGNTVIGWGDGPSLLTTEVSPSGEVVFEVEARPATGTVSSYRVRRYAD